MKRRDYSAYAMGGILGFALLCLVYPPIGKWVAWLAGIATLFASPFLLIWSFNLAGQDRQTAVVVSVLGIALVAIIHFPQQFAQALRFAFGAN